jgi:regulatory protein
MPSRVSGTVSAVEYQQKRPDRVNVYLDGAFGFALSEAVLLDSGLRKGQALSAADVARLLTREDQQRAYDSALNYLSYRPRSEAEVRRSLEEKRFAPESVEEALARLRRAGLLDDAAFARYWVENRDAFSPRGARALRAELRQRGVADEVVREATSSEERDDLAAARAAAEKKARQLHGLDRQVFRQRLGGYLARRGFSYEAIRPVVEALWSEAQSEQAEDA